MMRGIGRSLSDWVFASSRRPCRREKQQATVAQVNTDMRSHARCDAEAECAIGDHSTPSHVTKERMSVGICGA